MIERVTKIEHLEWDDQTATLYAKEMSRSGKVNIPHIQNVWKNFLTADTGAIWRFIHEDQQAGFIGGIVTPDIHDAEPVGIELLWYVSPAARSTRAGIALWFEFEQWAIGRGAKRIYAATSASNTRVQTFYERAGLKPMEISYMKEAA